MTLFRQIETRRIINIVLAFLLTMVLILEIWEIAHVGESSIAPETRPLKDHRNHLGPRLLLRFRPTGRCSQPLTTKENRKNEAPADPLGPRL